MSLGGLCIVENFPSFVGPEHSLFTVQLLIPSPKNRFKWYSNFLRFNSVAVGRNHPNNPLSHIRNICEMIFIACKLWRTSCHDITTFLGPSITTRGVAVGSQHLLCTYGARDSGSSKSRIPSKKSGCGGCHGAAAWTIPCADCTLMEKCYDYSWKSQVPAVRQTHFEGSFDKTLASCLFRRKERDHDKAEVSTWRGGTEASCIRPWLTRHFV